MIPQTTKRRARNSSRVNLLISFAFHATIMLALLYFAARQGYLGKQIKKIAVEMVKEKPPEKPKEPEKPKAEPPKLETPKVVAAPVEALKMAAAAPPPAAVSAAPPVVAPAAVEVPSFSFEGGKAVETSSDPVQLYKGFVEYSLRSRWDRPGDMDDHEYVAEVQVSIDSTGQVSNPIWKKSSGNTRWDNSVRQALVRGGKISRPPPPMFPGQVLVRFDVVEAEAIAR
ncbi:MAG TPA: TonB C-terminal domain-containing protein [Candidatus Saccharimonadales bacterium]|nr:TonB C-terminal domain-containing protein [Candidatus Saccharimonadales bacterium]